jgi:hypothetical protein
MAKEGGWINNFEFFRVHLDFVQLVNK